MIHMLCRFDLKPGASMEAVRGYYAQFFKDMKSMGYAEATGEIGTRIDDTPMSTEAPEAQRFYVVMTFRDRAQLDESYAYFTGGHLTPDQLAAHNGIRRWITNEVFTCWDDQV